MGYYIGGGLPWAGTLINTPQGLDAALIQNRLTMASYFSAQVTAQNAGKGYAGSAAASTARNMLTTVTATTNIAKFQQTAISVTAFSLSNAGATLEVFAGQAA